MTLVVRCDCGRQFEADRKLAGGFTNCPGCGRATEVPGLRDPLWRLAQVGAVVVITGAGAGAFAAGGIVPAAVAVAVGAALFWLWSRAL